MFVPPLRFHGGFGDDGVVITFVAAREYRDVDERQVWISRRRRRDEEAADDHREEQRGDEQVAPRRALGVERASKMFAQ